MENKRHRLLRYLNDAYASEVGGLMSLKDLAALAADDPQIRGVVEEHLHVSETQAERLKNRLLALGGDKSEPKAIVNSVIAKGSSIVNIFHDKEDKLTQDLIKAYAFEHFEIATYTSLRVYAEAIADTETALLAAQILEEERDAGEKLARLIPGATVQAAYKSTEMAPAKEAGGLFGIPGAALLLPGAVLAFWGVNKWLEGRGSSGGNQFGTATNIVPQEVTVITSDVTYIPSSLEDEAGVMLITDDSPVAAVASQNRFRE